ncbi:DUF262 domain-containing protein [Prolixibacteraceae bacterium]|nr:DUF262 domain-containing protein [Prolixibacteraceae bacterium]
MEKSEPSTHQKISANQSPQVTLTQKSLKVFLLDKDSYNLTIPEYQRIYCWEEKHVLRLLKDIKEYAINREYYLGSIILHKTLNKEQKECYHIVDGQQRLVTLALLLQCLEEDNVSLLNEKFTSQEAIKYIAYNKWLIHNELESNTCTACITKDNINKICESINFSVLVIESEHLDLAYTFFNSENSKGKSLTDYDLLKSHHLRYIQDDKQAEHLASRWDAIVLESDNDNTLKPLGRTFEIYLFRLRKWMRKRTWEDSAKHKIKQEFEAAAIIPYIPPFGEQFHFYESIQGGTHFFAFAEHFIFRYNEFSQLNSYKLLHDHLCYERHWWYRDVVESLLFAYFLKFGNLYIDNACLLILDLISSHRYNTTRAYLKSILSYASETEVVMMIDQATSPTFFLAEIQNKVKRLPNSNDLEGTRESYQNGVKKIKEALKSDDLTN